MGTREFLQVNNTTGAMNSRRRLSHHYPEGRWLFVTWTLHGSVPAWRFGSPAKSTAGEAFAWIDAYLDTRRTGPTYLAQQAIAEIVVDSLYQGAKSGHYKLGPFAVMWNHVHALFLPAIPPRIFLTSLKAATTREANKILNRAGEPFWERESYERWLRAGSQWNRVAHHIEMDPVTAGLVAHARDFLWSSAHPRFGADAKIPA